MHPGVLGYVKIWQDFWVRLEQDSASVTTTSKKSLAALCFSLDMIFRPGNWRRSPGPHATWAVGVLIVGQNQIKREIFLPLSRFPPRNYGNGSEPVGYTNTLHCHSMDGYHRSLWQHNILTNVCLFPCPWLKKVKAVYSASCKTHLRATGRHLAYGITQCYLPTDTSEHAPP